MATQKESAVKILYDNLADQITHFDRFVAPNHSKPKPGTLDPDDPRHTFNQIVSNLRPENRSEETWWYARMAHLYMQNDHRGKAKDGQIMIEALRFLFTTPNGKGLQSYEFGGLDKDGDVVYTNRLFVVDGTKIERTGDSNQFVKAAKFPDQFTPIVKAAIAWGEPAAFKAFAKVMKPAFSLANASAKWRELVNPPPAPPPGKTTKPRP